MAKTASTMQPLGTAARDFQLPDVTSGDVVALADYSDKRALVVVFLSRHCPYVKHIQAKLAEVGNEFVERGVGVVAICSNDAEAYPDDSPDNLRQMAEALQFQFPCLFDESQEVAKAYTAACTPDFFVFDEKRRLAYRGQFDDSRPGKEEDVTGKDLRRAVEAVLANEAPADNQKPSLGCNIKWKPGNEPNYAT